MIFILQVIMALILVIITPILFLLLFYHFPKFLSYKITFIIESRKFAKIDKKTLELYYRELPYNYSPAIVSVLSNSKVEVSKDLPATILNLCAKGHLKIIQDEDRYRFEKLSKNFEKLMKHELYLIQNIHLLSTNQFNYNTWKALVLQDTLSLNLIKFKEKRFSSFGDGKTTNAEILITSSLLLVYILLILFVLPKYISPAIIMLLSFILILFFSNIVETKLTFSFKRTKTGNEHYKKWLSFKLFLTDYSLIKERDINDILIWEYYLAYAISLKVNKKTIESFNNKIFNNDFFNIINLDAFLTSFGSSKSYF